MFPTITTFTELEVFLKWKTEWTFKFNWLFNKSREKYNEHTISFQKKISWDYKYIYFLNNIQIGWYKDKEDLLKSIKTSMSWQGFKSSADSENLKDVTKLTQETDSFENNFKDTMKTVDINKEVSRIQEFLNYFISWNWKLTQLKDNKWSLGYKFLQVDTNYKEYTILFDSDEQTFSISWSWITGTREQMLLDLIATEKYRNDIIKKYNNQ